MSYKIGKPWSPGTVEVVCDGCNKPADECLCDSENTLWQCGNCEEFLEDDDSDCRCYRKVDTPLELAKLMEDIPF